MIQNLLPELLQQPGSETEVSGITDDSRKAHHGDLFLAVVGDTHDGTAYVADAVRNGVQAVVAEQGAGLDVPGIPVFEVQDLAGRRGDIAAVFYDFPSEKLRVVAVTGTNGKTSCCHYIAASLHGVHGRCGYVGTLGSGFPGVLADTGMTTPDAITLQRTLAEFVSGQAKTVCLEASSHGLQQGRLRGVAVDVAVFTNISRDHLDYHESFADYREAKALLFRMPGLRYAVVNLDDPFGHELKSLCSAEVVTYALGGQADITAGQLQFHESGFSGVLKTPWGEGAFTSRLLGEFNVSNLLALTGALGCLGLGLQEICELIPGLTNARGRMDLIRLEGGPAVVIDYAHTPDALEKALQASRLHCEGQLWCVFGCGGDRDRGKRAMMAEISSRTADVSVVTSDNPRFEDPEHIIADILDGVAAQHQHVVHVERAEAIAYALQRAQPHDLVLIAGKGHEEYQEIAGERRAYSDYVEVARFQERRPHIEEGWVKGLEKGVEKRPGNGSDDGEA